MAKVNEYGMTFKPRFQSLQVVDNTRYPVVKPLKVTENGEYTVPEDIDGFSPVKVAVPLKYDEGYSDGHKQGYSEGYSQGHSEGYNQGYDKGYPEGYEASQETIILQEKTTEDNGEITADNGFTGLSKVIVNVPKRKEEQDKTIDITENGTFEILPDENKTLSKVNVNVQLIGKPYIDTSKLENFSYFFYKGYRIGLIEGIDFSSGKDYTCAFQMCDNAAINKEFGFGYSTYFTNTLFPSLDLGYPTILQQCFANTQFKYLPKMNTVNCTSFSSMLSYCRTILEISLDTSNGTSFVSMCQGCNELEKVSLTTAKKDFSTNSFQECTALTDFTIGEGWAVSIYLNYSNNLTVESLHGMIENLADLTGQTAKTFQIGSTNLAKIDEAHITMLQNKNWNYS